MSDQNKTPETIADQDLEQVKGGVTINHNHMTTGGQVAVTINHNHMPGVDAVNINNEYETTDEVAVTIDHNHRMTNSW